MKFNEFKYVRPDLEQFISQMKELLEVIGKDVTFEEELKAIMKVFSLNDDLSTQASLVSIRNSVDTRDEFYEKEQEFFQALQHLKHNKHEIIVFHTVDTSKEIEFDLENRPYNIIDMETGEQIKLQPNQFKEKYTTAIKSYFREIELKCTDYKIDFMKADINAGYYDILLKYLIKRQRMR